MVKEEMIERARVKRLQEFLAENGWINEIVSDKGLVTELATFTKSELSRERKQIAARIRGIHIENFDGEFWDALEPFIEELESLEREGENKE